MKRRQREIERKRDEGGTEVERDTETEGESEGITIVSMYSQDGNTCCFKLLFNAS